MSKSKATPKIIEHYLTMIISGQHCTVNHEYAHYTLSVESAVSEDFVIQGLETDDWVAAYIVNLKVKTWSTRHEAVVRDVARFLCNLFLQRNVFTKLVVS